MEQIKNAFKKRDPLLSKKLHQERFLRDEERNDTDAPTTMSTETVVKETSGGNNETEKDRTIQLSEENHNSLGEFVKSIIYGGLDGIITTFAIISAVDGANLRPQVALVLGFANLVADSFSMGIGDYLSESAEFDFARSERSREQWEFENYQEGEILEMIDIYVKKGVSREDAEAMLRRMAKYPDFFINHMLVEELHLQPVDEDESAVKSGLVTMSSFLIFGSIPLLSYVATAPINFPNYDPTFLISCCLTVITLLVLGGVKGKLTESSIVKSAFFVMFNGVAAASVSYLIGLGLGQITDLSA